MRGGGGRGGGKDGAQHNGCVCVVGGGGRRRRRRSPTIAALRGRGGFCVPPPPPPHTQSGEETPLHSAPHIEEEGRGGKKGRRRGHYPVPLLTLWFREVERDTDWGGLGGGTAATPKQWEEGGGDLMPPLA